mgnify:CR=1 FL=1
MAEHECGGRYTHHSLTTDPKQATGTYAHTFYSMRIASRYDAHGFKFEDFGCNHSGKNAHEVVQDIREKYQEKLTDAIYEYTRTQWDEMVEGCDKIKQDLEAQCAEELLQILEANTGRSRKQAA